jgi:hypothetical protein
VDMQNLFYYDHMLSAARSTLLQSTLHNWINSRWLWARFWLGDLFNFLSHDQQVLGWVGGDHGHMLSAVSSTLL